ncbi:MAG: hypothetical protein ABIH26_08510 [Candidatus Eisenbacteria bacterium]
MWGLVRAVTAAFDGLIGLFGRMNPMVGLLVVSVVTGVVMLVIFRYTSNQRAIARQKELIKAHILEIRLFKDDLRMQFAAQRRILVENLRYMRYAVAPMLVMLVPVLVILIQLDVRYARRPLLPGESTLLRVAVEEGVDLSSMRLEAPDGVVVETEPIRIPDRGEVNWRIHAEKEGSFDLAIAAGPKRAVKRLEVGNRLTKLSEVRDHAGVLAVWARPAESPLPGESPFRALTITYPERDLRIWGIGAHWLLVFFVVSVVFGFAIKGFVGVEV